MPNETPTDHEIEIGEIVIIHAAVVDRRDGRLLVSFERDGQEMREWFLAEELSGLGFDD